MSKAYFQRSMPCNRALGRRWYMHERIKDLVGKCDTVSSWGQSG